MIHWPGMNNDIVDIISNRTICATFRNQNQKEPMIPHEIPELPWQKVGSDLCKYQGKTYLVIVDYFSKYIEISLLPNKTAKTVITHTKSIFSHHGIQREMISDNMPYNSKEFRDFARDWGFKVTTSSPTYPQSNGLSEKAVQILKRILKKTSDPYIALLEYRNTPVTGMSYSPSQLLMSRITRSELPVSNSLVHPKLATGVVKELTHCQQPQKHYYDMAAKPLSPLKEYDGVRIRQNNTWVPAQVTHPVTTPRSYRVLTPSG